MSKFTIEQRKTVKDLVFQGLCQQKTLESISAYVKEKSGLEISSDEADRIRKAFRKEAREWLSVLASSNHEYIAEYRDRIEAVKYQIRRANELYDKPAPLKTVVKEYQNPDGTKTKIQEIHKIDDRDFKRRLLTDITNMESMLMEMYDAMPIVKQIMELKVGKMTTTATTNNETTVNVL